MPSPRAKYLWEIGEPLSGAWLRFASAATRDLYEAMPGFIDRATVGLKDQPESGWTFWKVLHDAVQSMSARQEKQQELREALLDALFDCQLVAIGFREAPTTGPAPVELPVKAFADEEPVVEWETDRLHFAGKTYGRVRIVDPKISMPEKARSRFGRPGSNAVIEEAIDQLIDATAGTPFCDLDRKTGCELIRQKLARPYKAGNGLSDKNLEKYLVRKCGLKRITKQQ